MIRSARNWIRFHVLGRHPLCHACDAVMTPQGRAVSMKPQRYKCLDCDNKEKSSREPREV